MKNATRKSFLCRPCNFIPNKICNITYDFVFFLYLGTLSKFTLLLLFMINSPSDTDVKPSSSKLIVKSTSFTSNKSGTRCDSIASTSSGVKPGSDEDNVSETSFKVTKFGEGMEMKSRRRMVANMISASMSTGRLLSQIGLARGEHHTVRKLSRIGVGVGRSERLEGVRYLKTKIAGVKVRLYLPETSAPLVNKPICIYLHGGGWVISSARCYHRFTGFFARDTKTVVISVDYRYFFECCNSHRLSSCKMVLGLLQNIHFLRAWTTVSL